MKKYFFVWMNGAYIARRCSLLNARKYIECKRLLDNPDNMVTIYDDSGEEYNVFGSTAPLRRFGSY